MAEGEGGSFSLEAGVCGELPVGGVAPALKRSEWAFVVVSGQDLEVCPILTALQPTPGAWSDNRPTDGTGCGCLPDSEAGVRAGGQERLESPVNA
jgi:hypothetical protein